MVRPRMRLVEDLDLRVVGDFGGATDDGLGGQQEILKDGAKERVGTEALGVLSRGWRGDRRWSSWALPASQVLVFAAEGKACAGGFVDKKKQAAEPGATRTWEW